MKPSFSTILTYAICTMFTIVLIGFGMRKQSDRYVKDLKIEIIEETGNYFLDQNEVIELLNASHTDYVLSLTLDQLDLKMLEQRLEEHAFVSDAQIYVDVTGTLEVRVRQAKPIARVLLQNGEGRYIDISGNLLPLNAKHTARVPILELTGTLKWEENLYEDQLGQDLMNLLFYIEKDKFWKAQVAHIILDDKGGIVMIPQVTKQEIRFGYPTDIENKFRKLRIFYKEILPYKGWNTYAFVDVKYKDQIVCE